MGNNGITGSHKLKLDKKLLQHIAEVAGKARRLKLKVGILRNSCAPKPAFTPGTSKPGRWEIQPRSHPGWHRHTVLGPQMATSLCESEGEALEGWQGHVPVVILGRAEAKYSLQEILSL